MKSPIHLSQIFDFDTQPNSANVPAPFVAKLYGVSLATVWRWAREGRIPKPHKFGPMTTRWNVGELRASLTEMKKGGQ